MTGSRREEIGSATWGEVDVDKRVLTLSPARMKADAAHIVPLTDTALAIFEALPSRKGYLFTTNTRTPVSGYSKAKSRMDELMGPDVADWRLHDLRRSVRTGLSALGVQDRIAELTIGHKPQGLQKIYDQHSFLDERRDALRRWERHLLGVIDPRPFDNVLPLRASAHV
jgi:integrase